MQDRTSNRPSRFKRVVDRMVVTATNWRIYVPWGQQQTINECLRELTQISRQYNREFCHSHEYRDFILKHYENEVLKELDAKAQRTFEIDCGPDL